MALNTQLTRLVDDLERQLAAGGAGARASVGATGQAFAWLGGQPQTVANFLPTQPVVGLTTDVLSVGASATPVGVVAEAQPKSNAIAFTPSTVTLPKHAGYGEVSLEQSKSYANIGNAVVTTLVQQSLMSFEESAMAAIAAGAGGTPVTAPTWVAAIVAGQAQILALGGRPAVLVLSATDYSDLVLELLGSSGVAITPDATSMIGAVLGTAIHVSPGLAPGTGWLLDPAAAVAFESETGPGALVDPYSRATSNMVNIVTDLFATTKVVQPALVCSVATTVAAADTTSAKKK